MLMAILKELHKTSSAIEASWIVSADGLALASVAPADTDEDRAAAICCGVLSVAQHAVKDLARGVLEKVSLISDRGCVLLANAGQESVLAVLTQPGAELDSVFLDVERAAAKCKILPADNRPLKNPRISFERTGSLLQP